MRDHADRKQAQRLDADEGQHQAAVFKDVAERNEKQKTDAITQERYRDEKTSAPRRHPE